MRIIAQTSSDATGIRKPEDSITYAVKNEMRNPAEAPVSEVNTFSEPLDNSAATKDKIQQAVKAMNDLLEVNNSASKFTYHEGLERYYVTVVNRETEEVIKEIPPKKLLDAFYEMQKMLGMIVDEKI
ncbi:flagellar protein FlaG [Lysinibacillus sp. 3P01SB]|uniref:flagellar protein FlaG n=1 Tax=Lysinibacillus sp. 3P01SB TaxID=3132284 RepID=UPI0039A67C69